MNRANALSGAPRIHGELLKLCPVDKQRAQVAIAALADPKQHITIATGVLTRHQPQPRREFATALEFVRITNRGYQRRRHRRSIWASKLKLARGFNVAAVALANKNARIIWALLTRGENYRAAAIQQSRVDGCFRPSPSNVG